MNSQPLQQILQHCKDVAMDIKFESAKKWKTEGENRLIYGFLPVYVPREILHAANVLPVGIQGAGDRLQVVRGDAYYQSYICHIPRGVIEMALSGHLDEMDGFLFPSICDVIRNLSGIFQILKPGTYVKYVDFPQDFTPQVGGDFYRHEIAHILDGIKERNGISPTNEQLVHSIKLFNHNRQLIREIGQIRCDDPWRLSAEDWYYVLRYGYQVPVEKHNEILEQVRDRILKLEGEAMDNIRVVITGAFCEQPPIGLIKTMEMAGCYIVDDDFVQGSKWIEGEIEIDEKDPIGSLIHAYLNQSTFSSAVYDYENPKGDRLIELARQRKADGIIFAAPSFCDPALLDKPELQRSVEEAGIRYIGFQYSENTGQFKMIREQVGAFSDSIKLWETPLMQS